MGALLRSGVGGFNGPMVGLGQEAMAESGDSCPGAAEQKNIRLEQARIAVCFLHIEFLKKGTIATLSVAGCLAERYVVTDRRRSQDSLSHAALSSVLSAARSAAN